jgi:toxin ParE1/3/4
MRYEVFLTQDAESDLQSLLDYIAEHDVAGKDAYVLARMEEVVENLSSLPERGSHPKELLALGIREYRQVFFKPYRVIYQVRDQSVYVLLIVDGRRDMQALLARRLLGDR